MAEDLTRNAEEQERLSSEVAALQEKLETLRHDQALLITMQQALDSAEKADDTVSVGSAGASLPRQTTPVPRSSKETPAPQDGKEKASRARKTTSKTKSAPTAPSSRAPKGDTGPTLRDLVVGHLSQEGEPRSALDVTDALTGAHPDRGIKITVVRSTLEAMVAKGHVRRSKQGKSVFYSAVSATAEPQPATV
ncbi:hypothetical protein AB0E10_42635 [Streptomyces sp. NPDC048045]|uniref:hypothetical protein n=1 Tax=Streptomyces sp. NPDC048045 TaxID=3154710 RepID=UPI00341DD230